MQGIPKILLLILLSFLVCLTSCNREAERSVEEPFIVRLNPLGYLPGYDKKAMITTKALKFSLLDRSGKVCYSGYVSGALYWAEAGYAVRWVDFTEFDEPGEYCIQLDDTAGVSDYFVISRDAYDDLSKKVLKSFYYNRASCAIDSIHGGKWARPAGHPDTAAIIHESAASPLRPAGTKIDARGGWYEGCDYNKYTIGTCVNVYTLLLAANLYQKTAFQCNVGLPETGNLIPDIVDEALYAIEWLLRMQDPYDGGVYHKLTDPLYDGFRMPHECNGPRYIVGKSTSAALDFAAVMAFASRTLPNYGHRLDAPAEKCLEAAKKAYEWAQKNPDKYFKNPEGFNTAAYDDDYLNDEWYWASAEMWLATHDLAFATETEKYQGTYYSPTWRSVGLFGSYSLATAGSGNINGAEQQIFARADELISQEVINPGHLSITDFTWGSNGIIANIGMLKMVAYSISGNAKYLNSAINDFNYLLSINAVGGSFVTGVGHKPPMHIHHRISEMDGIDEPIPGMLVGGPNPMYSGNCPAETYDTNFPATCYVDDIGSNATNSVSLSWNAPLLFLTWALVER